MTALSVLFMIRAAVRCAAGTFYEQTTIGELSEGLGLSKMHAKMHKTLNRLERFKIIERDDEGNIIIDLWPSNQMK